MLIGTHTYIAKKIINISKDNGLDYLNEKKFIYGNIKPDGFFQNNPSNHKREEATSFVVNKIYKLIYMDISTKELKDKFSEELGVVCHFLSDFYCKPHVERWGDLKGFKRIYKGFEHIIYEYKINVNKKVIDEIEYSDLYNVISVEDFLYKTYSDYFLYELNNKDICYAIWVSSSLVKYIVDSRELILNNRDMFSK